MRFETDKKTRTAVAIIAGAIAFSNLSMLFVAEGGGFFFLLLVTLVLSYVTVAAIKFRNVVEINKSSGYLTREFGSVGYLQESRHALDTFAKVGIDMGGRSASGGGATTVYTAVLVGPKNVKIPNGSTDLYEIEQVANKIAQHLDLPYDDQPKMGFFGRRL